MADKKLDRTHDMGDTPDTFSHIMEHTDRLQKKVKNWCKNRLIPLFTHTTPSLYCHASCFSQYY